MEDTLRVKKYFRDRNFRPVGTIIAEPNPFGSGIIIGLSKCNKMDSPDRAVGTFIAEGRLYKNPLVINNSESIDRDIDAYVNDPAHPQRVGFGKMRNDIYAVAERTFRVLNSKK